MLLFDAPPPAGAVGDGAAVNGSASLVGWLSLHVRRMQSGYLYSYAFWMVVALAAFLGWFLFRV